jgi:hypothetical protein
MSVPVILIDGDAAKSTATTPPHIADCCASWGKADVRKARKLLKTSQPVRCLDATAHAAMLAMGLDMMNHGRAVVAPIVKAYPTGPQAAQDTEV